MPARYPALSSRCGSPNSMLCLAYVRQVEDISPTRVRMTLTGPDELTEQIPELADRETACCSFFTFTLRKPTRADLGAPRHRGSDRIHRCADGVGQPRKGNEKNC